MMGFGFGGPLSMLILLVAVVGLAMWLISALFPRVTSSTGSSAPPPVQSTHETALDILKKRYARGELTPDEYKDMLNDLLKDAS